MTLPIVRRPTEVEIALGIYFVSSRNRLRTMGSAIILAHCRMDEFLQLQGPVFETGPRGGLVVKDQFLLPNGWSTDFVVYICIPRGPECICLECRRIIGFIIPLFYHPPPLPGTVVDGCRCPLQWTYGFLHFASCGHRRVAYVSQGEEIKRKLARNESSFSHLPRISFARGG